MCFEPLAGVRYVAVTGRRRSVEFGRFLKRVSAERCPRAERVVLVCDDLSTHTPAAIYEAFPRQSRRMVSYFGLTPITLVADHGRSVQVNLIAVFEKARSLVALLSEGVPVKVSFAAK